MEKQGKRCFKGQNINKDVLTHSTADNLPTEETELAFHKKIKHSGYKGPREFSCWRKDAANKCSKTRMGERKAAACSNTPPSCLPCSVNRWVVVRLLLWLP